MLGVLSCAVMTSDPEQFIWHRVEQYIAAPSNNPSSPPLNQVILFGSPHVSWDDGRCNENMVTRWGAAASAVAYTEEVGQSVVDVLLQIATVDSLRSHIPVDIWVCLKKRPTLPPECSGRSKGTERDVVRHVRALGDIEVFKSYLLLVWSEWDPVSSLSEGLAEMQIAIREDFSGIGMGRHRGDLIERLDHVLGQLDRGLEHFKEHKPGLLERNIPCAKGQYGELKEVLLEVDREAMDVLARTPPSLILLGQLTPTEIHRIPLDLHVRSASPMPVVCLERLAFFFSTNTWFVQRVLSRCCVSLHSPRQLGRSKSPRRTLSTFHGVVNITMSFNLLFPALVSYISLL